MRTSLRARSARSFPTPDAAAAAACRARSAEGDTSSRPFLHLRKARGEFLRQGIEPGTARPVTATAASAAATRTICVILELGRTKSVTGEN